MLDESSMQSLNGIQNHPVLFFADAGNNSLTCSCCCIYARQETLHQSLESGDLGSFTGATSSLQPHPSRELSSNIFMPDASQTLITTLRTALTSSSVAPLFRAPTRCPFSCGLTSCGIKLARTTIRSRQSHANLYARSSSRPRTACHLPYDVSGAFKIPTGLRT
jgi:hypothetical protein